MPLSQKRTKTLLKDPEQSDENRQRKNERDTYFDTIRAIIYGIEKINKTLK
jgi:hypothetical protein